ncbi:hypothetical protein LPJ59_005210, partial [Coemansia sp. RSA 2399]
MSRARAGYAVPANFSRAPVYSTADIHTGEEPVEIGVYNPIRARPMLRHERQQLQQQQQQQQQRSRSTSEAVAYAGRETPDGAIDVEGVDETIYNQESTRVRRPGGIVFQNYGSDAETDDTDHDYRYRDEEYDDDDEDGSSMVDSLDIADMPVDDDEMQNSVMFLQHRIPRRRGRDGSSSGAGAFNMRGRRTHGAYIFPFHPGLIPHGLIQRGGDGGRFNPLDYYANDDIGGLLSFLDATTPAAPPSRPLSPLEPLKLSANQEKLAASDEYSRRVPQANFRDNSSNSNPHAGAAGCMEIVCTQCTGSLFEKEAIWAPSCGHIMCNQCVEGISSATKTCAACKKRISKKSLVHVYA